MSNSAELTGFLCSTKHDYKKNELEEEKFHCFCRIQCKKLFDIMIKNYLQIYTAYVIF